MLLQGRWKEQVWTQEVTHSVSAILSRERLDGLTRNLWMVTSVGVGFDKEITNKWWAPRLLYEKAMGEALGNIRSTNGQCVEKTKGIRIHCLKKVHFWKVGRVWKGVNDRNRKREGGRREVRAGQCYAPQQRNFKFKCFLWRTGESSHHVCYHWQAVSPNVDMWFIIILYII